jgi:hypothetical protein
MFPKQVHQRRWCSPNLGKSPPSQYITELMISRSRYYPEHIGSILPKSLELWNSVTLSKLSTRINYLTRVLVVKHLVSGLERHRWEEGHLGDVHPVTQCEGVPRQCTAVERLCTVNHKLSHVSLGDISLQSDGADG